MPRPHLRPPRATATTRCRSCSRCSRTSTPPTVEKEDRSGWPVEERLKHRIIDGDRDGLEADLDEALATHTALEIVNDVLLDGMKVVGELFALGRDAAAVRAAVGRDMKTAVAYLEPHMEKADQGGKGRIVLATVKGDVHDIGKNLVDIILTNNGYEVHNLGIKVPIAEMIEKAEEVERRRHRHERAAREEHADHARQPRGAERARPVATIPVLLGGAALTRSYVERDLREVYEGRVFYGKDAFEGLRTMDRLDGAQAGAGLDSDPDFGRELSGRDAARRGEKREVDRVDAAGALARRSRPTTRCSCRRSSARRSSRASRSTTSPRYINETALFRNQWQFRPEKGETRRRVQGPHPARSCASSWPRPRPRACSCPRSSTATSPPTATATTSSIWKDETPHRRVDALPVPPPEGEPFLCIADFFRPVDSRRDRLRRLPHRHDGRRVSEATAELFAGRPVPGLPAAARPRRRDGRGAGRVGTAASARSGASPTRTGPRSPACSASSTAAAATRGATRRAPTSRTTLKVAELLEADRIGVEVSEETVPVPPRADHLGHHLPPPQGQVLRRPLTFRSAGMAAWRPTFENESRRQASTARATRSVPNAVRMAR